MLNEKLKMLRDMNEFTQQHMADALGMHRSTYAYYEIGKTEPRHSQLIKLAKMFNVTTDYLLGHELPKKAKVFYDNNVSYNAGPESEKSIPMLTGKEKSLLLYFRQLDEEAQDGIIDRVRDALQNETE